MKFTFAKKLIQLLLAPQLIQLHNLPPEIAEGFVERKEYAVVPPKVEYSLTKRGKNRLK